MKRTWRVVLAAYPKPWWEPEYDFWNPLCPYWRRLCATDASLVRKMSALLCFVDDVRRRRWVERRRQWAAGCLPFGRHFRTHFNAMMVAEYTEAHETRVAMDVLIGKAVGAFLDSEPESSIPKSMLDLPITLGPFHGESLN